MEKIEIGDIVRLKSSGEVGYVSSIVDYGTHVCYFVDTGDVIKFPAKREWIEPIGMATNETKKAAEDYGYRRASLRSEAHINDLVRLEAERGFCAGANFALAWRRAVDPPEPTTQVLGVICKFDKPIYVIANYDPRLKCYFDFSGSAVAIDYWFRIPLPPLV